MTAALAQYIIRSRLASFSSKSTASASAPLISTSYTLCPFYLKGQKCPLDLTLSNDLIFTTFCENAMFVVEQGREDLIAVTFRKSNSDELKSFSAFSISQRLMQFVSEGVDCFSSQIVPSNSHASPLAHFQQNSLTDLVFSSRNIAAGPFNYRSALCFEVLGRCGAILQHTNANFKSNSESASVSPSNSSNIQVNSRQHLNFTSLSRLRPKWSMNLKRCIDGAPVCLNINDQRLFSPATCSCNPIFTPGGDRFDEK